MPLLPVALVQVLLEISACSCSVWEAAVH
uniref:Uncharacterized protein n=1 Tax=Arundo donax TaxID=35708 RepID=A0A0A9BJ68_ARUDO